MNEAIDPVDSGATRGARAGLLLLIAVLLLAGWLLADVFQLPPKPTRVDPRPAQGPVLPEPVLSALLLRVSHRVAAFDFVRAQRALASLERTVPLDRRGRELVSARRAQVAQYLNLLDSVGAAARAGELADVRLGLPSLQGWWATPSATDRQWLSLALRRDRRPRAPQPENPDRRRTESVAWSALDAASAWRLLGAGARHHGRADGWLALSQLFAEMGRSERAERALAMGWQEVPSGRQRFATELSALRGRDSGPYQLLQGVLYDGPAIDAIKAGLVSWRGRWVSADARRRLADGQVERDGVWVKLSDDERRAQGWEREAGVGWVLASKLAATRRQWEEAWGRQTVRVRVRTDHSRAMVEHVLESLHRATPRLRRLLGTPPEGSSPGALVFDDVFNARRHFSAIALEAAQWSEGGCSSATAREAAVLVLGREIKLIAREQVGQLAQLLIRLQREEQPPWLDQGVVPAFARGLAGGAELTLLRWDALRGAEPPAIAELLAWAGDPAEDLLSHQRYVVYSASLVYFLATRDQGLLRDCVRGAADANARLTALEAAWRAFLAEQRA